MVIPIQNQLQIIHLLRFFLLNRYQNHKFISAKIFNLQFSLILIPHPNLHLSIPFLLNIVNSDLIPFLFLHILFQYFPHMSDLILTVQTPKFLSQPNSIPRQSQPLYNLILFQIPTQKYKCLFHQIHKYLYMQKRHPMVHPHIPYSIPHKSVINFNFSLRMFFLLLFKPPSFISPPSPQSLEHIVLSELPLYFP